MGNFNLERLVRPHIIAMKPYATARDDYKGSEGVFLDANENSLGSTASADYSRYPDPMQWAVKQKMQEVIGVQAQNIFLGNGSDEPIDLIMRAFCRPNIDNILLLPPTYGMYKVSAILNEVAIKNAPLTSDFQIDTDHLFKAIDSYTKVVFLCSPNNPTGNNLSKDDIVKILKNFDGIVVLDQAYADFSSNGNYTSLLAEHPNLIILKTFSKAWGLAALRIGMAFASAEIVNILNKIKPPYNINIHSQREALIALDNVDKKNEYVAALLNLRSELILGLKSIKTVQKIYPSETNFLLVRFEYSAEIFEYLIQNKVIVRDRSHEINCEGCLRITIGKAPENERLLQLLREFEVK